VTGKLWRIDETLEDSEDLRWTRERLVDYDWSKVDWITIQRGRSERYAFRGVCMLHSKRHGYRINCNASEHAPCPITQFTHVSPLYRNPNGTWPEVSEGHEVSYRYFPTRNGKSSQWKRLYRPL
jgi:hypothetical protein